MQKFFFCSEIASSSHRYCVILSPTQCRDGSFYRLFRPSAAMLLETPPGGRLALHGRNQQAYKRAIARRRACARARALATTGEGANRNIRLGRKILSFLHNSSLLFKLDSNLRSRRSIYDRFCLDLMRTGQLASLQLGGGPF